MIIKKTLIKRVIGSDTILVPVGKTVFDSNGLFALNELGDFIWDLLPRVNTEEEICDAVLAEYDVPQEVAQKDIREFLQKLRELEII